MELSPNNIAAAGVAAVWLLARIGERLLRKPPRSIEEERVLDLEKRYEHIEAYVEKLKGSGNVRLDITRRVSNIEQRLEQIDDDISGIKSNAKG